MKKLIIEIVIMLSIMCYYVLAEGESVNITVNYDTVKKIVVNHEEKTLPDGDLNITDELMYHCASLQKH
ncbi:MAG: hypothetical protein HFI90_01165 [Clostridia bacterium]|nr:hypothetical protein [Clostridia bacterium]